MRSRGRGGARPRGGKGGNLLDRCDEIAELIPLYADGGLDGAGRADVEEHLAGCEACRDLAREMSDMIKSLNELPEAEPPSGFRAGWKRRLEEKPVFNAGGFVYAAASVLLALVVLSGIGAAISVGRSKAAGNADAGVNLYAAADANTGADSEPAGKPAAGARQERAALTRDAASHDSGAAAGAANPAAGGAGRADSGQSAEYPADKAAPTLSPTEMPAAVGIAAASAEMPAQEDAAPVPAPTDAAYSGQSAEYPAATAAPALSLNEMPAGALADGNASDFGAQALGGDAAVFTPPPESAAGGDFKRTFTITLQTDDYASALSRIKAIGGWVVDSRETGGPDQYGGSSAYILRRVGAADYEAAKDALRQAGEVTYENETLEKYTAQIQDTEARIRAKTDEADRLTALLEKSEAIDVMTMVEARLGAAEADLDALNGQLRYYRDITRSAYLDITVLADAVPPPPETPASLGARIAERFASSWNSAVDFFESFTLWLSGAIVPLAAAAAIAVVVIVAVKSYKSGRRGHDK